MKRLVLIGGGHCHLEVLRRLAAQPRDLETVLLTPDRHAFYSGMIPGVIAGDYAIEDCRVDLAALARRAGARLLLASATGLDPLRRGGHRDRLHPVAPPQSRRRAARARGGSAAGRKSLTFIIL